MSEPTPPAGEPDTAAAPDEVTEPEQSDDEAADDDGALRKIRSEAKRLRVRLRDVEAERDELAGVVEGFRRRDAEQAAESVGLAAGSDLWVGGVTVAELLDDDGAAVDAGKVSEATERLLRARPHWRRPGPRPDTSQGSTSKPGGAAGSSWQQLLRSR